MTVPALDETAAERLVRLLGMLGSDFDGEIAAAGRKANELLRSRGLTWAEAIAVPKPSPDWRTMARTCRAQAHMLSAREFDFVANMLMSRREPTEKQARWLADIYQRVGP